MMEFIDMTPTWGEWGNVFFLFASKGERGPLETLRPDFAKALAAAQALNAIKASLSEAQLKEVAAVMKAEMGKQGF